MDFFFLTCLRFEGVPQDRDSGSSILELIFILRKSPTESYCEFISKSLGGRNFRIWSFKQHFHVLGNCYPVCVRSTFGMCPRGLMGVQDSQISSIIFVVPDLETTHLLDWNNVRLLRNVASLHQGLFPFPGESYSLLLSSLCIHFKSNE